MWTFNLYFGWCSASYDRRGSCQVAVATYTSNYSDRPLHGWQNTLVQVRRRFGIDSAADWALSTELICNDRQDSSLGMLDPKKQTTYETWVALDGQGHGWLYCKYHQWCTGTWRSVVSLIYFIFIQPCNIVQRSHDHGVTILYALNDFEALILIGVLMNDNPCAVLTWYFIQFPRVALLRISYLHATRYSATLPTWHAISS